MLPVVTVVGLEIGSLLGGSVVTAGAPPGPGVRLVWLGRRTIAGIEPGRRLRASGLVSRVDGRALIFNPRYELAPKQGE